MFTNIIKRTLSTSNISKILVEDIKQIGPYTTESQWIVNMIEDSTTADDKDGHSGFSYLYTKTIADTILKNGYSTWKTNHVHL